jgi:hypothetical protein
MSSTKIIAAAVALIIGVGACSTHVARDDEKDATMASSRFHQVPSFPAVPPPECGTGSCSAIAYQHRTITCADAGLAGVVAKSFPLRFATDAVVPLSAGDSVTFSSTMRILVRTDGGETVYYSWRFTSTLPIDVVILRGGDVASPDSIVYRFDPAATAAQGLQGAWIAWVCGENDFSDRCLFPFDPVEAEICYREPSAPDGGAGGDGGKAW